MRFWLSDEEYEVISAAAESEHLANGAFAAQAALARAAGRERPECGLLREALGALMQASGQARRIGVNLNQSVAASHSGEEAPELRWYAQAAARAVGRIDDAAEQVRRQLP
ncbi:hypothetical protein [Spirillospora sp. NPDC047279]|uniref:hypothetical protein n=1 Tax=Spirillospora sp. NPDC047279 TaxID=3155478 RepID=UPI00340BDDF7